MTNCYIPILIIALLSAPQFLFAQGKTPTQPKYSTGLPLEHDKLYDEFEVKATLSSDNYRDVNSKASVKKWAPIPGSQGSYGTCAAWATAYCARTILEAQKNNWTDKQTITDHVFSYGFIYRVTSPSSRCWGAFTSDCVRNMKDIGIPTYKEYNIHCPSKKIPKKIYKLAEKRKIKGYVKLWDEHTNNLKQRVTLVKKSLAEGNPVVISMICPNSFHYPTGKVWISNERPDEDPDNPHSRHAMCVVGYDDNKYGGAFEIQNSWGPKWGNEGYIWVKYEDFADFVYQAVELIQFDEIAPNTEVELAGELRFQRDDRMEMTASLKNNQLYEMNQAYRSGTRFRLYISNNAPAYVYAFGSDLTNKTYQVFPHKKNVSAALTYSKNEVPIPSEDKHIRMDGNTGTDYLCVLYSTDPINLDQLRNKIESYGAPYTFRQKVEKALGNKLMSGQEVIYTQANGKMGFKAKAKGKNCAAMFVAMEHID